MGIDYRVLVTGAGGFIGRAVVRRLLEEGFTVRGTVRHLKSDIESFEPAVIGPVGPLTDWRGVLRGISCVIHLIGHTHNIGKHGGGSIADFRRVNVDATSRLADAAVDAGVRRMVFVSSIKVNGERTIDRPFTAQDAPAPENAYGLSKWEAEQALALVAARTGLETVIVRPPLVYGPGVKANFARLFSLVRSGIPLPFGAVDNRRSLVALPNLVDVLLRCTEAPEAKNRTFLVSDGEDISTPALIREMAWALGTHPRLLPVPPAALRFAGRLTGHSPEVERLCGSLQVDIGETQRILGWRPPVTLRETLRQMA